MYLDQRYCLFVILVINIEAIIKYPTLLYRHKIFTFIVYKGS